MSEPSAREALERRQLDRLQSLLELVASRNGFYSAILKAAGVEIPVTSLAEFRGTMPPTTKQMLVDNQSDHPPFGEFLLFPLPSYTRFCQTSGTTGHPLRWLDTPESWGWMTDLWLEVYRSAGVTEGDRVFFAFSFGPFLGFWLAFDAGQKLGCLCIPGGGMSTSARLKTIRESGVTAVCCTPTYAIRLGEAAREEGVELGSSSVRVLLLAGEPGAAIQSTREHILDLWPGVKLNDHHGMTEIGPVSFECTARPGVLHVMEEGFVAEVIDPVSGCDVGPGQRGELILTNLGRLGSPLIRYRTGDLVELDSRRLDEPCLCGRIEMGLVGGILGRTDDMVVVRGVNIYPYAVEAVVRQFSEVAEYRALLCTVRGMTELRLQVEPVKSIKDSSSLRASLESALQSTFTLRVPVEIVPLNTLPRFEMKAKRWIKIDGAEDEQPNGN